MLRLGIAVVAAVLIGLAGGYAQYLANYGGVDERLASVVANATPVKSIEKTDKPVAKPETGVIAPRVEVIGGTFHDFGNMQQGGTKTHTFRFRNIGTAPLELRVVGSSCRCTIGTLENSSLAPGEETGVTLKWEARGVLDEFSQTATIGTNDPEHSQVLLSVKGVVARIILVEPQSFNLGDVTVTTPVHRTAFAFGYAQQPLEISDVTWADSRTADKVKVSVQSVPLDKEKFPEHAAATGVAQIDLDIESGLPLGPIDTRINMKTNVKSVPNLDVAVTGKIVGDIQLIGGSSFDTARSLLDLGTVSRRDGTNSRLHLSVQGPERHSIKIELGDVIPKDSLNVTIGEAKEQNNRLLYPITVTVPENAPPALFPGSNSSNFGKIIIKSSHPSIPEIRIYLRLVIE